MILVLMMMIYGGDENDLEGHHPDYSKPGLVITLCRKHHNEEQTSDML